MQHCLYSDWIQNLYTFLDLDYIEVEKEYPSLFLRTLDLIHSYQLDQFMYPQFHMFAHPKMDSLPAMLTRNFLGV